MPSIEALTTTETTLEDSVDFLLSLLNTKKKISIIPDENEQVKRKRRKDFVRTGDIKIPSMQIDLFYYKMFFDEDSPEFKPMYEITISRPSAEPECYLIFLDERRVIRSTAIAEPIGDELGNQMFDGAVSFLRQVKEQAA